MAAILCMPAGLRAQDTIINVDLTPKWDSGSKCSFICTNIDKAGNPRNSSTITSTHRIELEVVKTTDTGIFFQALFHQLKTDSAASFEEHFVADILDSLLLQYLTDEKGNLKRLLNVEDLKFQLFAKYEYECKKYISNPKLYSELREMKPFFSSDEIILQSTEEIPLIHQFYGKTYRMVPDTVYYENTLFANPYGDTVFPAVSGVKLVNISKSGYAEFEQNIQLDTIVGRDIILQTLSQLFIDMGYAVPDSSTLMGLLHMSEELSASYDVKHDGYWPVNLKHIRRKGFGPSMNLNELIINRVP
ncbi:MAG: hypothetical protein IT244_05060 [Bacteroidia bacterium]|nr:hypothetical protein [Bacteroidia bacterium]